MRIVACVKQVPDADSDRRMEEGRLVRGEDDVLNELDEFAVEAAVSLVESFGGEVVALTMGPEDAADALTRALQLGADRAVLLTDDELAGSDAIASARALAAAIQKLNQEEPIDLVFTGMASLDGMTSMLAPALATVLGWPLLDLANSVTVEDGQPVQVTIERRADGVEDILRASGPVVVSVTDQINEPRYPSFKDLRAARSKPLEEWSLDDLGENLGLGTSAVGVLKAEPRVREAGVVITDSGEAGIALADYLRSHAQA